MRYTCCGTEAAAALTFCVGRACNRQVLDQVSILPHEMFQSANRQARAWRGGIPGFARRNRVFGEAILNIEYKVFNIVWL